MGNFKGPVGPRLSGGGTTTTTVVPSFRFNKADDEMVEVTPTTYEDMEEASSIQDMPTNKGNNNNVGYSFGDTLISSRRPIAEHDCFDGLYRAGDDLKKSKY